MSSLVFGSTCTYWIRDGKAGWQITGEQEAVDAAHEQALAMNEEYDLQHGVRDTGQTKTERSL
jgi:hypothetical protein